MRVTGSSLEVTIVPFVAALACASAFAPLASAQSVSLERERVAQVGGSTSDGFGHVVRLIGDQIVTGAPGSDAVVSNAGEVQWFAWGPPASFGGALHGSDSTFDDGFGSALAGTPTRLAIGAPNHLHAGTRVGAVYVFAWNGSAWIEEAELLAPTNDVGFGTSVDVSGDTIVVGNETADVGTNTDEGSAYVFERVAGVWTFRQTLATPDHAPAEHFGFAVAIDGDLLAVSSYYGTGGYPSGLGAVHVFRRSAGVFAHEIRLEQPVTPNPYGTFGHALDVMGDCVAIGHPYGVAASGSGTGLVHLFHAMSGLWLRQATLEPVGGYSNGGQLGRDVQFAGDRLVAGAVWYSPWGFLSGGAYVFQRLGPTWVSWWMPTVMAPSQATSHYGESVTMQGERAVASAGGATPYLFVHDVAPRVGDEYCFGDGSGTTPCPCGNTSASIARAGCANDSFGHGAALAATGSTSVTANDLVLSILGTGSGHEPLVFFVGTARLDGGNGYAFGDGLRCVGGFVRRGPTLLATSNYGYANFGGGLAAWGAWAPGDTRYVQGWYRSSSGPCGTGHNLTNALELIFEP